MNINLEIVKAKAVEYFTLATQKFGYTTTVAAIAFVAGYILG